MLNYTIVQLGVFVHKKDIVNCMRNDRQPWVVIKMVYEFLFPLAKLHEY